MSGYVSIFAAYNVSQAPVDDSMADQSGKSIDISAAEHSGIGTSIDATTSDKPLPGHHRKVGSKAAKFFYRCMVYIYL